MVFTSFIYLYFFAIVFSVYWLLRVKRFQNPFLLVASYLFYGFIHPWFCILIAVSTVVDYVCGRGMEERPNRKRLFLIVSLLCNLGMLGFFKYFNFFAENVQSLIGSLGFQASPLTLKIFLPVGISFYTFQTLSYTIDIYRGKLKARRNFVDFALFVSLFPQLVAGPIERATRLLPQIETDRKWDWDRFSSAWPLIIGGFLKKLVIADNVAPFADKIFSLSEPSGFLLAAGTIAFSVQIYADFSAYTDIARGSARLLGFDLMKNFKSPYLSISPSDFWRRWHISFSSWIRDYLYIPLGGSKVDTRIKFAAVVLVSMGLSGLWHGAAWNFIAWGVYHAVLIYAYYCLGMGGKWRPVGKVKTFAAWLVMTVLVMVGWMIFRASSLGWLINAISNATSGFSGDSFIVSVTVLLFVLIYSMPLFVLMCIERMRLKKTVAEAIVCGLAIIAIMVFARDAGQDFIYFQF